MTGTSQVLLGGTFLVGIHEIVSWICCFLCVQVEGKKSREPYLHLVLLEQLQQEIDTDFALKGPALPP